MTIIFVTNVHAIICLYWHISRRFLLWEALNTWPIPPWFPQFLQPKGPYTFTPESPCTSRLPCGTPAAPQDTLCACRLALVQALTPLCLCLLLSLLLLSLLLTSPAQLSFWSQTAVFYACLSLSLSELSTFIPAHLGTLHSPMLSSLLWSVCCLTFDSCSLSGKRGLRASPQSGCSDRERALTPGVNS